MWKITRERDDGMRAGCVSAMLAVFSIGTLLLWLSGLIRVDDLISSVCMFSATGMICGVCSRLLEERWFAKVGFYTGLALLLLVIALFVIYSLSGHEWKFFLKYDKSF